MTMAALEIIATKRDGGRLNDDHVRWFMPEFAANRIPDYQAAALAMAIFFQGMDAQELATWTQSMIDSGETLDLSSVGRPTVDKHSTGGVGDKVSLILAPLVALQCHSWQAAGSATPAALSTNWNPSQDGMPSCLRPTSIPNLRRWVASSPERRPTLLQRIAGSMLCATPPGPWRLSP